MSERCLNPLCGSDFTPYGHGHPQKFCSKQCKMDKWALKRTAELLSPLPAARKLGILAGLLSANGNQCGISGKRNGNRAGSTSGNRQETNGNNQCETNGTKTYTCARWPYLTIGKRVKFEGGLFETDDPELQKVIEGNKAFGAQILEA